MSPPSKAAPAAGWWDLFVAWVPDRRLAVTTAGLLSLALGLTGCQHQPPAPPATSGPRTP
ncbi:hypothetical protein [Marinobacter lutaoensis]|uniref:hypothetical protein n=1 Tax=Marinobacter lutaoensis TaxID=135739 RepID=UPI001592B408|nr:hypothetical protein [Marinobacter lutaoensis]NVD34296.1 hypothetical protein [Marinobacter lutaoensis]